MQIFTGTIERVFATNGGWASIFVDIGTRCIRAVGAVVLPCVGDRITMMGEYEEQEKHGIQFKIFRVMPELAEKQTDAFGDATLEGYAECSKATNEDCNGFLSPAEEETFLAAITPPRNGKHSNQHADEAERCCARLIDRLAALPPVQPADRHTILQAIRATEGATGFVLNDQQCLAIQTALTNRVSAVTGGAGTGKTTIIRAIAQAYGPEEVVLLAITGKAAQRMAEAVTRRTHTVYKALTTQNFFHQSCRLIIVDESSMLDIFYATLLLNTAGKVGANIVFIGDVNQLKPIGPGWFFRDLVRLPCVPTVELTISLRQNGDLQLNAKAIIRGEDVHELKQSDAFHIIEISDEGERQRFIVEEYSRLLDQYGRNEILCTTNFRQYEKNAFTSSEALNLAIQEHVNSENRALHINEFRLGDRVMHTRNDYVRNVFNGDCGTITGIDQRNNRLSVLFDKGLRLEYDQAHLGALTLAYAMTIHKAQGSEYQAVIIPLSRKDCGVADRNSLYTAVTRAKTKVVIVGEKSAINKVIRTTRQSKRKTN